MKFALAQMDVIPGSPERNIQTMLAMINEAKQLQVDLIAFPELCISGYILADTWVDDSFCRNLMTYNEQLLEASNGIAIAYGNIFIDQEVNSRWSDSNPHPNKDGRSRKYNAVYVIQNGKYAKRKESNVLPKGIQPKSLLPEYRIFDDERYFFSLQDVAKDAGAQLNELVQPFTIETMDGPTEIGFEICEDLWCEDYRKHGESINVTNLLIENGAKIIVNISASPWNIGKSHSRDRRILHLRQEAGERFVPFLYVNKTGVQNNGKNIITFDGGTSVYNRDGHPVLLAEAAYQQKLMVFHDTVFEQKPLWRKAENPIKQKFEAIVQGILHFKLFMPEDHPLQFVIGLSGGIDSAVVAGLLTTACGKENVLAVNMPSRFNSEATRDTAREIAGNLGIDYFIIPIEDLAQLNRHVFDSLDERFKPPAWMKELSDENIQAKIRGTTILSNLAGRYGRLMTNNGNKLEIALGYSTLYGDVNGALAPIGDLTKTEVYAMARFLNLEVFKKEVIPANLFPDELFRYSDEKIVPGPELKKEQISPIRFGYHCALLEALTDYLRKTPEEIMQWYLEGILHKQLNISIDLLQRWQIDNPKVFIDDLEWFISTINKNIFKRIQTPPIIITSKSAYGYDIRESMKPFETSILFKKLKEKIMYMKKYGDVVKQNN